MNASAVIDQGQDRLVKDLVDYLAGDTLCLEIRHYPPSIEAPGENRLHLLIIMERELTQAERRQRMEELTAIADRHGRELDVLFSSPKVWRDLTALVGPFSRIEKESVVLWKR